MPNNAKTRKARIKEALSVLIDLGMPRAQQNDRSALCLLALLNLNPERCRSTIDRYHAYYGLGEAEL